MKNLELFLEFQLMIMGRLNSINVLSLRTKKLVKNNEPYNFKGQMFKYFIVDFVISIENCIRNYVY